MVYKWQITYPAPTGPEERWAYIYLPDSYESNPYKRYPVLYMFDGHNLFFNEDATYGKCWGIKEYMDYTNTELIIAAVECNHSPNNGRLMEYSPFSFDDPVFGSITSYGKDTMEWLIHTFKKEIDQNYRTLGDRSHTFIGGSSMGGLMSLYAVVTYNHIFSGAACLSPSLWTHPENIEHMLHDTWIRPHTTIYMDYGSEELHNHPGMKKIFYKTATQLLKKNVYLTSRIVPRGSHCEACWEKQIPFFMNALLYDL